MNRLIFLLILLTVLTSCKTSEERQEEVDYVPPWIEQKDKAHDAVGLVEDKDKERRRQMDILDH